MLLLSRSGHAHVEAHTVDVEMLVVAVEVTRSVPSSLHGAVSAKARMMVRLGLMVGIHYAQVGHLWRCTPSQIFVVHDKDVGVARTMFLHLVVEVFRYQQVIVPTVAEASGSFVESFAHG